MDEKLLKLVVRVCDDIANELGISYDVWADAADLHRNTILRLVSHETKYPRFQTVVRFAAAVGVMFETHQKKNWKKKKAS